MSPHIALRRPHIPTLLRTALATLVVGGVAALAVPAAPADAAAPVSPAAHTVARPVAQSARTTAAAPRRATTRRTFYVSPTGSDRATGHTTGTPLRTLAGIAALHLKPGDRVLLQRGSTFTDPLAVTASGIKLHRIVVGAYGPASAPAPRLTTGCVSVTGDYVTVAHLYVANCPWAAIHVYGDHDTVRGNSVTGSESGVWVDSSATNTLVTHNLVFDNDTMAPNTPGPNDDYGAFGILVNGAHTEVSWNRITGQVARSADYGTDGSAVEVYEAQDTWVHHNTAINDLTFTELGGKTNTDTRFDYNVVTSTLPDAGFLITRGTQDAFGPVLGTVAANNSVLLTGAGATGVYCMGGCTAAVLTLWNNVLDVSHAVSWVDGPLGGGDNVYWQGYVSHAMLPGDVVADPDFVNPTISAVSGGNLRLTAGSPAIDLGDTDFGATDLDGHTIALDGNGDGTAAPDAGAFEHRRT